LLTGLNGIMIPLNYSSLTMAGEAGAAIGADQVSFWNSSLQDWTTATDLGGFWDNDFAISIGGALMANALAPVVWPAGPRGNSRSANISTSK
jgi:hypothetical protein